MKHTSLFCRICIPVALLVMAATAADAQEMLYREGGTKDSLTILADTAYIRSQPSVSGQKIAALEAGRKVWVVEKGEDPQLISGFGAPWMRVRFWNKGLPVEGYVWGGLTALGSYQRNGLRFLYGLDHALASGVYYARVKVLDSASRVLTSKTWELRSSEAVAETEGKVLGGMGLDSISTIVRVYFSGAACGVPSTYYYFGWNGTELLTLPGKTSEGDAGAYYHTEELLFPSEKGGAPGKIIRLIEDAEATDKVDKNGEYVMKTSKSKDVYSWDGRKAVKL